jgi:serine/threonine protein phosphatase PrpC
VNVESAQISLLGDRKENQDRVAIIPEDESLLLAAVDGMGGHANGARAAEITLEVLAEAFYEVPRPIFDPQGFLTLVLARAHDAVVELGDGLMLDEKPRATCALCLVQESGAYWAHIGDSRIYHVRNGSVLSRSRDHSHVEVLIQEGAISEEEALDHPMRNFVECCIGGDATVPDMSITTKKQLLPGDTLLACSDGLWSGLADANMARIGLPGDNNLPENLKALSIQALTANAPYSDNTTGTALRWSGA